MRIKPQIGSGAKLGEKLPISFGKKGLGDEVKRLACEKKTTPHPSPLLKERE